MGQDQETHVKSAHVIWIQTVTISLHVYFSTWAGGLNRHIYTHIFKAISFFFSNKVLFWDFSRMILICSLQFFFHVYDRWRNNVGVRVLRVLFLWKYIRIFLPSVSHVRPTPFTSLTACSKEFDYLTYSSVLRGFPLLWQDFAAWPFPCSTVIL